MNELNKIYELKLNLPEQVIQELKELAKLEGVSLPQAVVLAITNQNSLTKRRQSGAKVLIDAQGKLSEVKFAQMLKSDL